MRLFQNCLSEFKFALARPRSKSFFESKTYNGVVLGVCVGLPVLNVFFSTRASFLRVYLLADLFLFVLLNFELALKLCLLRREFFSSWLYRLELMLVLLLDALAGAKWALRESYSLTTFLFLKVLLSALLLLSEVRRDSRRSSEFRHILDVFFVAAGWLVQTHLLFLFVCAAFVVSLGWSDPSLGLGQTGLVLVKWASPAS